MDSRVWCLEFMVLDKLYKSEEIRISLWLNKACF